MANAYILVVDDEPDIRGLLQEILEDEGFRIKTAEDGMAARGLMRQRQPDLILLDIWMPDIDGISLLKEWVEDDGLPCPVIMMSGHGTVETAVEATRLGAYDFLEKPLSMAKLLVTIERALEADKLQRENLGLRKRGAAAVAEPIGKSSVMQRLREQVKRIAQHDTWVLVSGESGSGRETFARYLHTHSARRDRPFVEVSVASAEQGGFARELFGFEQEEKIHYGAFERARGGTLFIDEVSDLDQEAQMMLLGTLDTGQFVRQGGVDEIQLDVRIVAATRRNLEEDVRAGRFREELFYHLNVVPVHVPALREHNQDVPELLNFYADYFASHEKLPYREFSVGAQNYLRNYGWNGNVLELKNLVQRVLILGAGDEVSQEEIESILGGGTLAAEGNNAYTISFDQPLRSAREAFERTYLEYQLDKHLGNVSKMAKEVGMERTHLYRKLRALEIEIKDKR
jgi:two-component system nitrogen regulation response regulator NtrX